MELKLNSVTSAETKDDSITIADVTTSSPNNAKPNVSGSVCCPQCGSSNYEEYEELMYSNGIDDAQYGGDLKMVKVTDCRDCG